MSEKRTEFFFSYKNGNSRQVTKEEYEREWLEWWKRNDNFLDKNADKQTDTKSD